ncbi:MAG: hypothetical protein Q9172_005963 [Xanthocarpia lactea]
MPLHQRSAFAASPSTSFLPERLRPPVPSFSDSTTLTEQHLNTADSMHDSDATATWGIPAASTYNDDMLAYQNNEEHAGTFQHMTLLRINSTSSVETPQTVSPYLLDLSTPASGFGTYESTPATNLSCSPNFIHSNDPSPVWAMQPSPAVTESLDYDQSELGSIMFGELPGSDVPQVPAAKPAPKQTVTMARNKSSPGKSPRSPLSKVIASGVKKSKPLPDICPDPNNPKAMKTARNTQAARKSRARKVERFETLVAEVDNFRSQVDELQSQADIWKERALRMGWSEGLE